MFKKLVTTLALGGALGLALLAAPATASTTTSTTSAAVTVVSPDCIPILWLGHVKPCED